MNLIITLPVYQINSHVRLGRPFDRSVSLVMTPLLLLAPDRVDNPPPKKNKNKKQTNWRKKKRQNTDLIQHTKKVRSSTSLALWVREYMWLSRELSENPKQIPKMLTHFSAPIPVSAWLSLSLTPCYILIDRDPSLLGLSPQVRESKTANSSTPCLRLDWPTSLILATPTSRLGPLRRFT